MDLQLLAITFLVSIVFVLILFHFSVHGTRLGQMIDKIPGPKWYPIIGNTLDIVGPIENLWHFYRRAGREFYPVYKFWVVNWPVIGLRHPDDIEILLRDNKNISKSVYYDLLHPWLNDGLLTSTGDKWKSRRKILTPAFHLNKLHEYSNIFTQRTERLITTLKKEAESGNVDKELLSMVSRITLHSICETIMGIKSDENNSELDKYRHALHDFENTFYYRSVRPWLKNNWIFSLTSKGQDQLNTLKILHGFTTKIIEERLQYHNKTDGKYLKDFSHSSSKNSVQQSIGNSLKKRLDFIDLLIDASKRGLGIDKRGIEEEVDTFVFEGHDTTAMSIFLPILLLADHKDIQARARNEINAILEENDGKMTFNEVQRFDYLECCIKESLRLYPAVPLISRKISEDLKLRHCLAPKGAIANISIFDVHRDPNFWPRPNIFDPDRFLPENVAERHPFSYIPFSSGLRNCIGQKLAMLQLKTIIAGLLHNFYFVPLDDTSYIRILPDIVLRPAYPVHVKFVPIHK